MVSNREFPTLAFKPPKSFTSGRPPGQPSVIFIHTTEGSEGSRSAEDGAAYDARRTDSTSTHFFVDSNSIVQCVYTWDRAHAARAHGNRVGIQIEVCGKAGQTSAQWRDETSAATIKNLALLCVMIRRRYGTKVFPLLNLTPAQLRGGLHGFAEHYDATKAWPADGGSHTDPGKNFPWALLFNQINAIENVREEDDDMDAPAFFASAAKAARGDADATAGDRTNRNNAVQVLRFALGLPVDAQTAENLPCGPDGVLARIESATALPPR